MSYTAGTSITGGVSTVAITAGTVANTVVKATPGRLCRVLVTSVAGAAVTSIFDNATTNSGTVLAAIPASAAIGTVTSFEMPAAAGITVGGASTNPAMTISFD
jgi:predicted secreted protein